MIKGLSLHLQGQNSEPEKNVDFLQKKKKKKLLTAVLALECETGMLLSYYKGGLITENNVFVFSSAVLVTQCYVRANLQLSNPLRTRKASGTCDGERRALQVLQDRAGARPKRGREQKPEWSVTCSECALVLLEMRNGAFTFPILLRFYNTQSIKNPYTDFEFIPVLYF